MVSHKMPGTFINPAVAFPGNIKPATDILNTVQAPVDNTTTPTTANNTASPKPKDVGVTPIDTKPQVNLGGTKSETKDPIQPSTTSTKTEEPVTNTGDGIESALGTEYSWDTKAEERANLQYQSDVLNTKQQFLTNKQEIETQGQQAQQEFVMKKYSQNQSNEKAGWTGGYILDTERQMNYLKQTIQAQMYGQMELQKYGYDTSLAAARLAYDTNKYDLALEYYNTALQKAVTEAEITGYYLSPDVKDMLDQYALASKQLEEGIDPERAQKVMDSVNTWFESNGISKQGVATIAYRQWVQESIWAIEKKYENLDTTTYKINTDSFVKLDDNGNPIYLEGMTDFDKINFETSSEEDLYKYLCNEDGTLNTYKVDQYYSRVDSIAYEMENSFKAHMGEEGANKSTDTLLKELRKWLQDENTIDGLKSEINRWDSLEDTQVQQLFDDYSVTIDLPNGEKAKLFLKSTGTTIDESLVNLVPPSGEAEKAVLEDYTDLADLLSSMESNQTLMNELKRNLPGLPMDKQTEKWIKWSFTFISDLLTNAIQANEYDKLYTDLSSTVSNIKTILGEKNIEILKTNSNKYQNLSERDKALLDEDDIALLKQSNEYYTYYKNLVDLYDYAQNRANVGGVYAQTSQMAGQLGDIWEDGYQFGDVASTVSKGVSVGVTAIAETALTIFGKGWLWGK